MRLGASHSIVVVGVSVALVVAARSCPVGQTLVRVHELATKPREERLIERYGECDPAGYGYIKRVLMAFPDEALRPTIRYQRYNRKTEYRVEPVRFRALPFVTVGVGFSDAALKDGVIDSARRVGDAWELIAPRDFDALTGFEIDTTSMPAGAPVRIALHDGARTLWSGAAISTGSNAIRVLVPTIQPFAIARGPDPFRVTVTPADSVVAVRALGRELDLSEQVLVHREGNCLVTFEKGWFDSLDSDERATWLGFANSIPKPGQR